MKNAFEYEAELSALREDNNSLAERFETVSAQRDAMREELAKYKGGCVDLSSQVRELEHKMDYWKGEGKRADAAEQRNAALLDLLRECQPALDKAGYSTWQIDDALKPTESGASE